MMPADINDAFAKITPIPYVIITSLDAKGKPNAMGLSWVTRVSASPPLMLISVGRDRYSREGISMNREYVINYVTPEQTKAAWICGTQSGKNTDKIAASGFELIPSTTVKTPTIKDSLVAFECRVAGEHEAGDHTLFIGEVIAAVINPLKTKHLYYTSENLLVALDEKGSR
jgi:flavin reductase (DIM6/NTAB) family NADH-FMN oxidoreductase RutF